MGHCPEDLAHDFVMPSITKNNDMLEFKNFLEYDDSWNEVSIYMNFEFLWRCCGKFACFKSFLLSLTTFLTPRMVFYKTNFSSLIEIEVKLTHALESCVAYWQHLDISWPQQVPTKGVDKPKTSQDTIEVKTKVMVERLFPSSLTYAIIWALSPYFARKSFNCKAMALLDLFSVWKNPKVTWQCSIIV